MKLVVYSCTLYNKSGNQDVFGLVRDCVELQLLNEDDFCDKPARTISTNEQHSSPLNAANTG